MKRRVIFSFASFLLLYLTLHYGNAMDQASRGDLGTLGPWYMVALTAFLFGISAFIAISGTYRPNSEVGGAMIISLMYAAALAGFTEPSRLVREYWLIILGLGTLPGAWGSAFARNSFHKKIALGVLSVLVGVTAAIFWNDSLIVPTAKYLGVMMPAFFFCLVCTKPRYDSN